MNYTEIRSINVNTHIEKKNGLSYLSWAWAVDQLLLLDSEASWEYGEPRRFGKTLMVFCMVTAFGKKRTAQLPVMDFYNRAIPNPDAYQVNTAMQRCLAKAIWLHGIGLYIYAGEDLPEEEATAESKIKLETKVVEKIKATEVKVKPANRKITPTAGAMDSFTKEEQELLHIMGEKITYLTQTGEMKEATDILGSLTNEEKVAVWSLLGSKVGSLIKNYDKEK